MLLAVGTGTWGIAAVIPKYLSLRLLEKSAKKFFYLRKIAYLCTLETKTTKMAKKDIKLSELPEEVTGDGVKIYHTVPGTL